MNEGLVGAFRLASDRKPERLGWEEIESGVAAPGTILWAHLERDDPRAEEWLAERSGVDAVVVEALLAEETRPRTTVHGDGVLINFRGVNLNPDSVPEDMVSIRIWADANQVISSRLRPLRAVTDVLNELDQGRGPSNTGEVIVAIAEGLIDRMAPVVHEFEEELDDIEDRIGEAKDLSARLAFRDFRRKVVTLRRYIAPQRDALTRLASEPLAWIGERERRRLFEVANDISRLVEALAAIWERAAILQDELATRLADMANRRLYVLSVVAAVFLPLGFVTGLLGVNVGGIPGSESKLAFALLCGGLVVFGVAEIWLFRRLRWL
jgi:zinc transporter